MQLCPDHERRSRAAAEEPQQEDEGLELQGLQSPEVPWSQERAALQQEVRLFRRNTIIFYMKLRGILLRWRLGRRDDSGDETFPPELEKLEGFPELGAPAEQAERDDRLRLPQNAGDAPESGPSVPLLSPDRPLQQQRQFGENRRVLQALRALLEEFREELREEETRRCQLQQAYASDRAAWEVKWAEMKCRVAQMQRGVFSGQDGLSNAPSTPTPTLPARSHSDSEALVEEQGATARLKGPMENLFLDALSLDPLGGLEVLPPTKLESEKRFPCMTEALNEISDSEGAPDHPEEEMREGGSLLRAKSVCSMSDFQRLMDSSPFLPDKTQLGDHRRDDVTPPLSPDDLKYIEEFNNKGWDFPPPASGPRPVREGEPGPDPFQPTSWFLTTSATLTTSTLSSPEHCHKSPLRGNGAGGGVEHFGVHILHSPTRAGTAEHPSVPEPDLLYSKGRGEAGMGPSGSDEVFSNARWPCLLEGGGLRTSPNQSPICSTVGYASSLELQLQRNMSDDMKEVAISVRNAIRSPPGPAVRDTACQTSGFTTRGTQTTQTISVGLQTDLLRNLTSSPNRCLTPKGGNTPISSPSRSLRKVQYSPVVQSKFERPCCSPKYGSPKLQRKLSTTNKPEVPNNSRAPTPTTPQKGNSESAWARSTTTRDSPVHTTINDGLSSLFNIIDHTPVVYDKFNKSPSRSRPTPPPTAEPSPAHQAGIATDPRAAQDGSRAALGRSPSPVQLIVETQGDKNPEVVSIRQDLSAPPGYTLAENAARILNKKLQEQNLREERRLQAGGQSVHGRDGGRPADSDRGQAGCMENHTVILTTPWGL